MTDLATAIDNFASTFTQPGIGTSLGPHLTCFEAEAIADLLTALGHPDEADALIEGHASEEEAGDMHYRPCMAPVKRTETPEAAMSAARRFITRYLR